MPCSRRPAVWRGLIALVLALPAGAEPVTEVIPLHTRLPEDVVATLRPLAGPDGSVTPFAGQLIVRAEPDRLEDIRRLLEQIDRPPRRLQIHVRQRDTHGVDAAGAGAVARGGTAGARVRSHQTRSAADGGQRVLAVEGQPAQIQAGVSVPVTLGEGFYGGWVPGMERLVGYRDATAGFRVVPRVAGDQVTLEIQQHAVRPQGGAQTPPFALQSAETTVRGRLGEWLPLGAVTSTATRSGRGVTNIRSTRREGDVQLEVMVEVLPDR